MIDVDNRNPLVVEVEMPVKPVSVTAGACVTPRDRVVSRAILEWLKNRIDAKILSGAFRCEYDNVPPLSLKQLTPAECNRKASEQHRRGSAEITDRPKKPTGSGGMERLPTQKM